MLHGKSILVVRPSQFLYDTLDIQLGRLHDRDIARIFDKTVTSENVEAVLDENMVLLHWALHEIGTRFLL